MMQHQAKGGVKKRIDVTGHQANAGFVPIIGRLRNHNWQHPGRLAGDQIGGGVHQAGIHITVCYLRAALFSSVACLSTLRFTTKDNIHLTKCHGERSRSIIWQIKPVPDPDTFMVICSHVIFTGGFLGLTQVG